MKIGIDIQSLTPKPTGIGYYVKNLVKEYGSLNGIDFCYYNDPRRTELNTLARMRWENISLAGMAGKDGIDLLHIPGFAGPLFRNKDFKRVITVHDLIGLIYPQNLAPASRFYWQRWLPACVKKADFIIADSLNTKNDIMRLLNIPPEKIRVVYLACDERFKPTEKAAAGREILKGYGISKKYILNVGTIEPRKNVAGLIEAFGGYLKKSRRDDLALVIAGMKGWGYAKCNELASKLGLSEKVVFCDYVKDEDMPVLYNHAEAFVYPSFYEGFGLPVLEAMSCGLPVICSNVSSMPEVGGDAVFYIDPARADSIEASLRSVLDDDGARRSLSGKSLSRSGIFSWAKTACETIAVYQEVLGR